MRNAGRGIWPWSGSGDHRRRHDRLYCRTARSRDQRAAARPFARPPDGSTAVRGALFSHAHGGGLCQCLSIAATNVGPERSPIGNAAAAAAGQREWRENSWRLKMRPPPRLLARTPVPKRPSSFPRPGRGTAPSTHLKFGDTFAVLDSHGDMGATSDQHDGVFHHDTRFLSQLELRFNGMPPLLLGSNVSDDNSVLNVGLTNPDIVLNRRLVLKKDTIHIVRTTFLWRGCAYQRLGVHNHRHGAGGVWTVMI